VPTDVLQGVHLADLDDESIKLLQPYREQMAELVRAKTVYLHGSRGEFKSDWHETQLDDKKVFVAIV
jgi:hypothetical protein